MDVHPRLVELIKQEGWNLFKGENKEPQIEAFGKIFPVRHPVWIRLKLYREETNPDLKFEHMLASHFYFRPDRRLTWHYWSEERFRAHCEGHDFITLAGGGNIGKSQDVGDICCLFYLANPAKRGVVISSTTLDSLQRRIWGYAMKYLAGIKMPLPIAYTGGNTPKILCTLPQTNEVIKKDTLHGMFAMPIKQGDAQKAIKDVIGTHPEDCGILVLDECTDIPSTVIGAFENLDMGEADVKENARFQVWGIGNSNSVDDLHGALSTPKVGWENINPMKDKKWETTQKNGVCLFHSCYDSPAIHETDPEKKKRLSKFLMTEEKIEAKKAKLGQNSDEFYRFVLGFWRHKSTENSVVSEAFLKNFRANETAHYSGITPINVVGGLDLAFSTGGDQCLLRLGVLGVDVNGLYVLDFRDEELTFPIPILRTSSDSADIQIGNQVMKILNNYNCPLNQVAIDATGQGRAMGGVLQLLDKGIRRPISVYSTKTGVNQADSFDVKVISTYELWYTVREFVQAGQIRGLGNKTIMQLSERKVERMPGGKIVLESKADYKRRIGGKYPGQGHSPDHADSAALAVQAAITNFGFSIGKTRALPQVQDFNSLKYIAYHAEREQEQRIEQVQRKLFVPRPTFKAPIENFTRKRVF